MRTFVTSDLHFGWKSFYKHNPKYGCALRPQFKNVEEADAEIIKRHNEIVPEFDSRVYFLGDISKNITNMSKVGDMNGQIKILVAGNHDARFRTQALLQYFDKVIGLTYINNKKYVLSHCPIHESELRDAINVHGHTHLNSIDDIRYYNACLEVNNYYPTELKEYGKN